MDSPSETPYASIAVVGKAMPELWFYEKWMGIVLAVDPLISAAGHDVSVRTTQMDGKEKQLRFGKLGWNERSHRKWTHNSPDTGTMSAGWTFMCGEVWAPGWSICEREKREPTLFISFEDPLFSRPSRAGQYNQIFHVALPVRFFQEHSLIANAAVEQVVSLLDSVECIMRVVPWNLRGDSIQDAINNHLHYLGMEKDLILDLPRTSSGWVKYEPEHISKRLA